MTKKKQPESVHDEDYDRWGDAPGGSYIHVIRHGKENSAQKKKKG